MIGSLFSLIIPNFNYGTLIAECLESVCKQTYSNWEAIIIDDCSTDNSVNVVKQYVNRDERIKLYHNKRRSGVGYSKHYGVLMSKGCIVGTLGADDTLDKNAIAEMIDAHKKNPFASLVYSSMYFCDSKLNILYLPKHIQRVPSCETYLSWNYSTSGTICNFRTFKKEYYLKTAGYDVTFKKAVDKDIIYKLEEVGKTVFIDKPLYYYRLHENNISRNKNSSEAFLWEVRAKEKAYYRRLGTNIPSITKEKLMGEFYYAYIHLAFESLKDKKYSRYLKYCWQFLCKFKNPLKIIRFVYYTLKKHFFFSSFYDDEYDKNTY